MWYIDLCLISHLDRRVGDLLSKTNKSLTRSQLLRGPSFHSFAGNKRLFRWSDSAATLLCAIYARASIFGAWLRSNALERCKKRTEYLIKLGEVDHAGNV